MAKMPELVELHERFGDEGLVVVGINFDDGPDDARKVIAKTSQSWPQVHASSAAKGHDELWEKVAGIRALPRLFLVDRDGVLHDDFYPHGLTEKVEALLGQKGTGGARDR